MPSPPPATTMLPRQPETVPDVSNLRVQPEPEIEPEPESAEPELTKPQKIVGGGEQAWALWDYQAGWPSITFLSTIRFARV